MADASSFFRQADRSDALKVLTTLIFVALVCAFAGCSSAPSGNSQIANAANAVPPAAEVADANIALAEGSKLLDTGDTDKAIEMLKRAVELDPDLGEAYFKLGIAYSLVESRDASVVEEQVTPTPLPGDPKPKEKDRAKTESEQAFEKAVEAYKKYLATNDKDDLAHFNLGRAYNKLNKDEDAAKALKEAAKLKPDDTEYQTELGGILVKLAQYREAIPPLKKALEIDPDNSRAIDLLDEAEAGRRRVDFSVEKKDDKAKSNSNSNSNTSTPSDSNTSTKPADPKPPTAKTPPPANKPK